MKIRIVSSPYSDVRDGEFGEIVEKRWVGLPEEVWCLQVIPEGKGEHCARCGAPARRHYFKLRELSFVAA